MSDGPEHAHEIISPGRPRTAEVADGVYAYVQPDVDLVDQQLRLRRRPAGRVQYRRVLNRAAHACLPGRHRERHRRAGADPGQRAYAELAGTPRGGPIDIHAALTDMVAYIGGRRLTCLA